MSDDVKMPTSFDLISHAIAHGLWLPILVCVLVLVFSYTKQTKNLANERPFFRWAAFIGLGALIAYLGLIGSVVQIPFVQNMFKGGATP